MNILDIASWLVTLVWVVADGLIIYWGILPRAKGLRGWRMALIGGLVFAGLAFLAVIPALVFIQPDERGVVISAVPGDQGVKQQALQPGLQWIVPFFQNVILIPISHQTYTMSAVAGEGQVQGDDSINARTKDGQEVFIEASVIYAIDPEQVVQVHIKWQDRYQDDLVRPSARGIIRDVVSQYSLNEIIPETRPELAEQVAQLLRQKLGENGLTLIDLVIRARSPEEHSTVLPQPLRTEVEKETATNWQSTLRAFQGGLQTIACLAFPVFIVLALFARRRREGSESLLVSADYERGLAHLARGERAEAIEAFMAVHRTATDPALRQKAFEQLEALGAVKKF